MFNFLQVKTKLQNQVEEYVNWKKQRNAFIAEDHKEILNKFVKENNFTCVREITLQSLDFFYNKVKHDTTSYTVIRSMEALRSFFRFHCGETDIKPANITNEGIIMTKETKKDIQDVGEISDEIQVVRPKRGRPLNIELVKKVKRLKDNEGLSFRQIAKALNKDVKNVYFYYKYDLSLLNL